VLQRSDQSRPRRAIRAFRYEPRRARERLHAKFPSLEVGVVERRDLQLAAVARFQFTCECRSLGIVKIRSRDGVRAYWASAVSLDGDDLAVVVELNDAVVRRVAHLIGEDQCSLDAVSLVGASSPVRRRGWSPRINAQPSPSRNSRPAVRLRRDRSVGPARRRRWRRRVVIRHRAVVERRLGRAAS